MGKPKRGPWSGSEDDLLMPLIEQYGASNWVLIADSLHTRTAKQCRERYHQKLKPSLNHNAITPEEGVMIESLVARHGKRWAMIARKLNGRSDNAVKNWWNGNQNRIRRRRAATLRTPSQPGYSSYLDARQVHRGSLSSPEMVLSPDLNRQGSNSASPLNTNSDDLRYLDGHHPGSWNERHPDNYHPGRSNEQRPGSHHLGRFNNLRPESYYPDHLAQRGPDTYQIGPHGGKYPDSHYPGSLGEQRSFSHCRVSTGQKYSDSHCLGPLGERRPDSYLPAPNGERQPDSPYLAPLPERCLEVRHSPAPGCARNSSNLYPGYLDERRPNSHHRGHLYENRQDSRHPGRLPERHSDGRHPGSDGERYQDGHSSGFGDRHYGEGALYYGNSTNHQSPRAYLTRNVTSTSKECVEQVRRVAANQDGARRYGQARQSLHQMNDQGNMTSQRSTPGHQLVGRLRNCIAAQSRFLCPTMISSVGQDPEPRIPEAVGATSTRGQTTPNRPTSRDSDPSQPADDAEMSSSGREETPPKTDKASNKMNIDYMLS